MMRILSICPVVALAVLFAMTIPAPAMAQVSISRSPTGTNPALGRVTRGLTATTFSISTNGAVSRSGDAILLSDAGVSGTTVTIGCGFLNLVCAGRTLRVSIKATGATGSASFASFRVGSLNGTSYATGSAPTEASSLTFDLNGLGLLGSCNFALGMDVLVPANAALGASTYTYSVTVTPL